MRTNEHPTRHRRLPLAGLVFVLFACCTPGEHTSSASAVGIRLKDFAIHASVTVARTGSVDFDVYNAGPATHEFVVVRTDLPADQLPLASDGVTVNEDALEPVGEISEVSIWGTQRLELHLAPGRYVFFCNLDGHYLGGMYSDLVVSDA